MFFFGGEKGLNSYIGYLALSTPMPAMGFWPARDHPHRPSIGQNNTKLVDCDLRGLAGSTAQQSQLAPTSPRRRRSTAPQTMQYDAFNSSLRRLQRLLLSAYAAAPSHSNLAYFIASSATTTNTSFLRFVLLFILILVMMHCVANGLYRCVSL